MNSIYLSATAVVSDITICISQRTRARLFFKCHLKYDLLLAKMQTLQRLIYYVQ